MLKIFRQHYVWIIFAVAVLVQICFPISLIAEKNDILKTGAEFKIKTQPIDPADPFRGRYVAIGVAVDVPEHLRQYDVRYIQLKTGQDGYAEVAAVSEQPIEGEGVLKLKNAYFGGDTVRLPFDRYYMQEKAAPKAEKMYNAQREDAYITLRIKGGKGAISGLYIKDTPIEQYISTNGTE